MRLGFVHETGDRPNTQSRRPRNRQQAIVFLRRLAATFIPAIPTIAVPISIVATLAAMCAFGFPTASLSTMLAGTAKTFPDSLANQGLLIAGAILTIYIVLGILYESFIHPLTILTGLPSAAIGAPGHAA